MPPTNDRKISPVTLRLCRSAPAAAPAAVNDGGILGMLCRVKQTQHWHLQSDAEVELGLSENAISGFFRGLTLGSKKGGARKQSAVNAQMKAWVFRHQSSTRPKRLGYIAFVGKGGKEPSFHRLGDDSRAGCREDANGDGDQG